MRPSPLHVRALIKSSRLVGFEGCLSCYSGCIRVVQDELLKSEQQNEAIMIILTRKMRNAHLYLVLVLLSFMSFILLIRIETTMTELGFEEPSERDRDRDSESTDASSFYKTTWPPVQKALCGSGAPNKLLFSKLFELGSAEVFAKNDPRMADIQPKVANTSLIFFSGDYDGGWILEGTNEEGKPFHTIYMRVFKCGNDQIGEMLKEINNSTLKNGGRTWLMTSENLTEHLDNYPVEKPAPCIYTALRDPISHFLSGYNEIDHRLSSYSYYYPHRNRRSRLFTKLQAPDLRFKFFVEDLLSGNFESDFLDLHVYPMSRILVFLQEHKARLTGYLPQITNLTSTFPAFLSTTCPNMYPLEPMPTGTQKKGQHQSSKDLRGRYLAAKDIWKEAGPTSRALCVLHAFDYACFPDLPDGIPLLCQSIYEKYAEEIIRVGSMGT